jgi:hypothetical protein
MAEGVQNMTAEGLVLSLKNEEREGQETTAEQLFDVVRGADRGLISAERWAAQYAPDGMTILDARNAAGQSKTQLRMVNITGATAGARASLDLAELDRRTRRMKRRVHRQAVMAGGCGGWCAGASAVPQVRTAVVVEWDQGIATWCRKNTHVPGLTLDLLQVKEVHAALLPFLPLHSLQISSPCTDFSTAGKG